MKLLLTGATGFIGSSFYADYREKFVIERFSFREDLSTLSLRDIDTIVHLSALVHQMDGASEEAYDEINFKKTVSLAHKAKKAGVRQFIFMSSVKVYGEESEEPYSEATPCHPKDPYGVSKLKAENALLVLQSDTFKISIIRTPLVYGEGVKANVLKLVELVDRYRVLPFGSINNKRSVIYVCNLTYLIAEIIKQEKNGVFLASDERPISTSNLIKYISKAFGKHYLLVSCFPLKAILRFIKPKIYQRLYANLYLDNRATKTLLSLQNPFSTEEGINKMVQWYKEKK